MKKDKLYLFSLICIGFLLLSHTKGYTQLTGDYTMNASFYDPDERIGTNTTQYLREHSSAESWLFLNYRINQFRFSVRHDLFHNSPLLDPDEAYTRQGIPYYAASIDIDDLTITAGSFYDQFGSGLLFRAFEDRQIGLDYAMQGIRLEYDFTDNLSAKAFSGQQKNRFDRFDQVVTGGEVDYYFSTDLNERPFSWRTQGSVLNRTLNQAVMEDIANEINSYDVENRFEPKYNVYGVSGHTSLRYANFNISSEYAYKTEEAIRDQESGLLINSDGFGLRNSFGYNRPGFGITLRHKHTDNFSMRTHPFTDPEEGVLNYVPSFTKQHPYRLTARYSASNHEPGERGFQLDATWRPARGHTFSVNASNVEILDHDNDIFDGEELFREFFLDYERIWNRAFRTTSGIQRLWYNQREFEQKPEAPIVEAWTGFVEARYRLTRQHSFRTELQYLHTDQDQGDFAFIQLEYNFSPHWSFSVSDLVNTRPQDNDEIIHFYSVFASYRQQQTQFTLTYTKQPEGVVCTGGVCRVEPAFSGVRFGVSTNF